MEEENTDSEATKFRLEEPAAAYASPVNKRLVVSTFEQQEEEMYRFWLELTPEQRLNRVFEIHKGIYGEDAVSSDKKIDNRIHFDTP